MMTENTEDVSVIICAYTEERWSDLSDAIESIQQQTVHARELILVIDHNKPLLERVQRHLPGVTAIENSGPTGLSGARNSGIARAKSALVAFLDDDAIAEPDWLERLCGCFDDEIVLGAGGTVEPAWTSEQPAWFPREFNWVVGCTYLIPPEQPIVVRNPFGGCTCFRRSMFEGIGGFRSEIGRTKARPMGCEETELCIRARQHWPEKVFLYEPRARIHHRIPPGRATWRYFSSRCYSEGLSKALVAQFVGAKDGLASERAYTLRMLPLGVARGIRDGLLHLNTSGFTKAGAIIVGLFLTTSGFIAGTFSLARTRVKEDTAGLAPLAQEAEQGGELAREH